MPYQLSGVRHPMRRTDAPLEQASAFDRLVLPREPAMPIPGPERALVPRYPSSASGDTSSPRGVRVPGEMLPHSPSMGDYVKVQGVTYRVAHYYLQGDVYTLVAPQDFQ